MRSSKTLVMWLTGCATVDLWPELLYSRCQKYPNTSSFRTMAASRHISAQLSERGVFRLASLWHYTIKD
ncbi:hypothetical protein OUZ56_029919 [Daphnia magna]|uniref:Secreted protein n=1 Tax=Daphnia magna TaxID=35525 RepID=A0ABR0B894_9CRUS|nr:hypothetical protein OUZ56_029919 [Daphnia magna]